MSPPGPRPNGVDPALARLAQSRAAILRELDRPRAAPPALLLARAAREHPWALLGGAAAAGALLVALRPWRWLPRPPVLASLLSQLAWQALAAQRARRALSRPAAPAPAADGRTRA